MKRIVVSIWLASSCMVFGQEAGEDRASQLLKKHPEADANGDGVLSREEWKVFREKKPGNETEPNARKDEPRSPMIRSAAQELASVYEALEYEGVPYRFLDVPKERREEGKKYPLILSLHGAGGKGDDNLKNLKAWNGIIAETKFQEKYPCFVVAPQTTVAWREAGKYPELTEEVIAGFPELWKDAISRRPGWGEGLDEGVLSIVFKLLDEVAQKYPVDVDRVYVLGHSMGGFGSFESAVSAPERFAAVISSAGGLSPWRDVSTLREIPIWAFHGDRDVTVPYEMSRIVFEELKRQGGNMKLTRLANVGHGASSFAFVYSGDDMVDGFETYYSSDACNHEPDVWEWLFSQKRK